MTPNAHEHNAYDSRRVANSFLELANGEGLSITHMKLQKLVYIVHGWHLAIYGSPLIRDEVRAWPYGPVIPVLYDEFKAFGDKPITKYFKRYDFSGGEFSWTPPMVTPLVENDDDKYLIRSIYRSYGKLSPMNLSDLTHKEGSPWHQVFEEHGSGAIIGSDIIREHFQELVGRYEKS